MTTRGATFTWYGHAAVRLQTPGGLEVLLDPWLRNPRSPIAPDGIERCDVMLVSHGHFDHLGGDVGNLGESDAVAIARRTRPTWPCIHELSLWLARQLPDAGDAIVGMNKGGTVDARGIRVTMVRADHSAGDWDGSANAPLYLGEPVGFVLELEDGTRVYYAGDTDLFGDMSLIARFHAPEIAFLPIGGHFTMGPRQAAAAAGSLGVKRVVPIHYGTFPILAGSPDDLRRELAAQGLGIEVVAPEPGEETAV